MRYVVFTAALLASTAAADEWRAVETAEDYAGLVTGRELVKTDGTAVFRTAPDRSIDATIDGSAYQGVWTWIDDHVCYDGVLQGAGRIEACARVRVRASDLAVDWLGGGTSNYALR